jgi:disulfide oxidoreductase YuzD
MKVKMCLLGFALLVVLSGCSDPVQEDLLSYINEDMKPLAVVEEEVIAEYDSVTGDNYVDDMTTYMHIEEVVIPMYRDFIEQLEAVDPATSEVQQLHESYIEAVNIQNNGMLKILAAIDQQDYDMIAEANDMLAEGRAGIRSFTNDLEKLAEEHNVEMTD